MDVLGKFISKAIQRWTAESPKTAQVITDVALGAGIVATVVAVLPFSYPAYVLPITALLISISAKLTVK
jgi:hypothetical protein